MHKSHTSTSFLLIMDGDEVEWTHFAEMVYRTSPQVHLSLHERDENLK